MITTNDTDRKKILLYSGCIKLFRYAFEWYAWFSRENHERVSGGGEIRIDEMSVEDRLDRVMRHLADWDQKDTDGAYHIFHAGWQLNAAIATWIKQTGFTLAAFLEGGQPVTTVADIVKAGTSWAGGGDLPIAYISGPMTGYPDFNFATFDNVRDQFLAEGWNVISPADMDRAEGVDYTGTDKEKKQFIERDIAAILSLIPECGDAIVMLPEWENSTGAQMEYHAAAMRNITTMFLGSDLNVARMLTNDERDSAKSTGEEQRQQARDGAIVGHT